MADASYQVIYKAIADFSDFSRGAAQAKRDLDQLQKAQDQYNRAAVRGSAEAAAARKEDTSAIKGEKDAVDSLTRAVKEHTAAVIADAAATRASASAAKSAGALSPRAETATRKEAVSDTKKLTSAVREESSATKEAATSAGRHARAIAESGEAHNKASLAARAWAAALSIAERGMAAAASAAGGLVGVLGETATDMADISDSLVSGMGKLGGMVSSAFSSLSSAAGAIIPVLIALGVAFSGALVTGAAAASTALIGLIGAIGSIGAASAGALPAIFALGTAFASVKVAMSGFSSVFKAFTQQQTAVAAASQNTAQNAQLAQQRLDALKDAEYGVALAQQATLNAQNSLNEARVAALRSLQDLKDAVKGAPLDEKEAQNALALAKENYLRVSTGTTATGAQRTQAELGVEEAQRNLANVQKGAKRNQEDLNVAQKKGVEGSDQVVAAKQSQAAAEHGLYLASRNLNELQKQQRLGNQQVAQATNALALAMSKLSPSAQIVAKALMSMYHAWKLIQTATQEAFFSKLVGSMGDLRGMLPTISKLLTEAAGAMGTLVANSISLLTSGPFKRDFAAQSSTNVALIKTLGGVLGDVLDIVRNIAVTASPMLLRFAGAVRAIADHLRGVTQAGRDSGKLTAFFDRVYRRAVLLWDIIKNVTIGLFNFFRGATPLGDRLLTNIDKLSKKFKEWSDRVTAAGGPFERYINRIKPLLTSMGKFFGDVLSGFGKLLTTTSGKQDNISATKKIFDTLDGLLPTIFGWLQKILNLTPTLLGGITTFSKSDTWATIKDIVKNVLDLLSALKAIGFVGALQTFANALAGAAKAFTALGDLAAKWRPLQVVLKGILTLLGLIAAAAVIGKFTGINALLRGVGRATRGEGALGAAGRGVRQGFRLTRRGTRGVRNLTRRVTGRPALPPRPGRHRPGRPGAPTIEDAAGAAAAAGAPASGSAGVWDEMLTELRAIHRLLGGGAGAGGGGGDGGGGLPDEGGGPPSEEEPGAGGRPTTRRARARAALARGRARVRGFFRRGPSEDDLRNAREGSPDLTRRLLQGEPLPPRTGRLGGRLGRLGTGRLGGTLGRGATRLGATGAIGAAATIVGGIGLDYLSQHGGATGRHVAGVASSALQYGALGATIGSVIPGVGTAVGAGVGAAIGTVAGIMKDPKMKKAIADFFTKTVPVWFKEGLHAIKVVWDGVVDVIVWPFKEEWRLIKAAWDAVTKAIGIAFTNTVNFLKTVWNGIVTVIEWPFKEGGRLLKIAWGAIKTAVSDGVGWVTGFLGRVWNTISAMIEAPVKTGWRLIKDAWGLITRAFYDAKGGVVNAVTSIANGIGRVWSGVKEFFKEPVKFVIQTVMNDGIIRGVNWLTNAIGLHSLHIGDIPLPRGFAAGDYVPRGHNSFVPGVGDGDRVPAMLAPGEFVVRKAAARVLGTDFLRSMNRADGWDGRKRSAMVGELPHRRPAFFWGEGVLKDVAHAGSSLWNATGGKAVAWAGSELRQGARWFFEHAMQPVAKLIDSHMADKGLLGEVVGGVAHNVIDTIGEWAGGVDSAHSAGHDLAVTGDLMPGSGGLTMGSAKPGEAFAEGGFVGDLLRGTGLAVPAGVPSFALGGMTPRSSSSTNNSTVQKNVTVQNLVVNYPKPEPAGDSIMRTLSKVNYYAGRG